MRNKTHTHSRESVGTLAHVSELFFTLTALKGAQHTGHLYVFKARTEQN